METSMETEYKRSRMSECIHRIRESAQEKTISLGEIFDALGSQSHGFMIILLSVPFMLPIPIPGLSVIFGILIIIVSFSWFLDRPAYIPKKLRGHHLKAETLLKILRGAEKIISRVEVFVKPRYPIAFQQPLLRLLVSLVLILSGAFLSLPLPPGTNFPPAIVMFILALGIMEDDLVMIILGCTVFVAEIFIFKELVDGLLHYFSK